MHIAHVIGFLFLLKIREILIFNIRFTAFIKILPVGELPTHNHIVSIQSSGEHNHTASSNKTGTHSHVLPTANALGS